jgi:DNA primase large subunit
MRYLHGQLRKEKHLKHSGRMQYGLFLKGLGLTMEEALIFWRQSFSNMTDDKFQKGGYAYNIRHNYGKEGKRANYTPYGCMKIITSQPSAGDHHGCPFKHFSVDNLLKLLSEYGINEEQKKEIAALARSGHFQLACTKYGEIIRARRIEEDGNFMAKEIPVEFINHPNQFFDYAAQAAGLTKEEKDDEVQR